MNIDLARIWRDDCLQNHSVCKLGSPVNAPLPTRLLDVTNPDSPFLTETETFPSKIPYIALSYCWGPGKKFVTLQNNLDVHRRGIPSASLPLTFRDAIWVTKALGCQYIWIDALCVVQDDMTDMHREFSQMGNVYRHAELTVAAQGASSSHAGLFSKEMSETSPLALYPCTVQLTVITDDFEVSRQVTLAGTNNSTDHLAGRGWVLQEEVLSSRALVITSGQIGWECMQSSARETSPILQMRKIPLAFKTDAEAEKAVLGPNRPKSLGNVEAMRMRLYTPEKMMAATDSILSTRRRSNHFDAWYGTVETYSDKLLTNEVDTLRALTELKDGFVEGYGTTYLAGLWKEDLINGLGWYVGVNDARNVWSEEKRLRAAPSWSWASVGKVRIRFVPRLASEKPQTQILDAFCDPDDPIKNAGSGRMGGEWSMRLLGPLKKALLRCDASYSKWRINVRTYGGAATAEEKAKFGAVKTVPGVHPRFPALLIEPENPDNPTVLGEAVLDSSSFPSLLMTPDGRLPEAVIEVFCMPLRHHSAGLRDGGQSGHIMCLLLLPHRADSCSYLRIGLGFLQIADWFSSTNSEEDVDCEVI
ncbi:heterokaryon incompatibility protein-domain-containing protein [Podospora didyma]|uniref:Heterokaryon incompatibility protein-domain-containing protein n=1 Tax=Podospora didyma TaxID=330526 RepID=A0AAE0NG20_9PEZI|nr:heterokaryon incompatibility protein-domain-containing protein [Podospora didyma]